MLVLFDLDGTLISSYMDEPDRAYDRWRVLPGRVERLAALRAEGHALGVATNQAGVAFGHVTEEQVRARLRRVLAALELPPTTPVEACFGHPDSPDPHYRKPELVACRKPRGWMLRRLIERVPGARADTTLYVGDRPEDRLAAENAGVGFRWAEDFFAGASPAPEA